jgi:hypothetical protein
MNRFRQRGLLLVTAVFLLIGFAAILAALASLNTSGISSGVNHGDSARAYMIARSGIEYAKQLHFGGTACGAGLVGTQTVDIGNFTISNATQYTSSAATLSGAVTATDTTIAVSSTAGYAPYGRILIDREEMSYGAISGNNFINVKRGTGNTVAAAHALAAIVYQGHCAVRSVGVVGDARRDLTANMSVPLFRTGIITKKNTVGTGTVAYTGVGFRPSVLIFYWTRQTAIGTTAQVSSGVGFAASPAQQYAVVTTMEDAQGNSDNGRYKSNNSVVLFQDITTPANIQDRAALASMDADGFTLNWNLNGSGTTAYRIAYIALGGEVQGAVGNFTLNNAVGNQAVTGTGFRPDLLLFLTSDIGNLNANLSNASLGLGFASSSSRQGALVSGGQDNINTNIRPRWQQLTDKAVMLVNSGANPPTATGQAGLFSMDSDGFTLNVTTASGGANRFVGYLALRGVRAAVGSFNQPTSTSGVINAVADLAFQPTGLMLASRNLASGITLDAGRTSIGAGGASSGSAASSSNIWFVEESGVDTSNTNSYSDASNIISLGANNTVTNAAQASLSSRFLGGFSLNWAATTDAVARQILYWAIAPRDYSDIRENY